MAPSPGDLSFNVAALNTSYMLMTFALISPGPVSPLNSICVSLHVSSAPPFLSPGYLKLNTIQSELLISPPTFSLRRFYFLNRLQLCPCICIFQMIIVGINLDFSASSHPHIQSYWLDLQNISRIQLLLTTFISSTLDQATIISRLDCCSSLLSGFSASTLSLYSLFSTPRRKDPGKT